MRIELDVDYAGLRAEEEPHAFRIGGRRVGVSEVIDRWLGPDHRYVKLRGDDGAIYILRFDEEGCIWELAVYDRSI